MSAHGSAAGDQFLIGVNYWPRRKAMFWWEDFDPVEVREEFAIITELGITHVRIFLLWESFQPTPGGVRSTALDHLRAVCDIAADLRLQLQVTFFTGHMSGPGWAPEWLVDRSRRRRPGERQLVGLTRWTGDEHAIHDPYATPLVLAAEDHLLRTVCLALRDHPAVWSWSLGNEPDLFYQPVDAGAGRQWVHDRVRAIRAIDPIRPVLIGLHYADIEQDVGFRVDDIALETDISVMHGYPMYVALARHALDPELVPFTAALTAALAGRPVLYEEFGVNTHWPDRPSHWRDLQFWGGRTGRMHFASEDDAAAYVASVLSGLVQVGSLGAFLWCFADYHPSLWDRPPCDLQVHERFFGLVRPDGTLKPAASVVRDFARTAPVVQPPARTVAIPVSPARYYQDPAALLIDLYARFCDPG